MKKATFVMLDDYADWEGAYLSSQLNQDPEWEVKTASVQHEIRSIGGFRTVIDEQIEEIPRDGDLLVLIGGNSWALTNESLKQLVQGRLETHQPVAAICGAVDYLAENGLLTGYKHTGNAQYLWNGFKRYQNKADFMNEQVVYDRNLVTANGTAALSFTRQVLKMVHFKADQEVDRAIDLYQLGFYRYCQQYGNPFGV